jgi:hypothetical protein
MTFDPALAVKRPDCHNRPEPTDPNAGWQDTGWTRYRLADAFEDEPVGKRVLRYRHPWFTFRCTVHDKADIGPGQTYAQFHSWDCTGCRHNPTEAK